MSIKNLILLIAAAGAFAAAIFIAAGPQQPRIAFAVPMHKAPR